MRGSSRNAREAMHRESPPTPAVPRILVGTRMPRSVTGQASLSAAVPESALEAPGFHLVEAAVRFARVARRHRSRVWVSKGGETADAKSPLELLALGDFEGSVIRVRVVGPDAQSTFLELDGFLGPSLVHGFPPRQERGEP
ncbi:MAG: HPr family phosphocarrier protein [Thermodesulfobacteriota bacterium]